jgi:hypothetical protein
MERGHSALNERAGNGAAEDGNLRERL